MFVIKNKIFLTSLIIKIMSYADTFVTTLK